MQTLSFDINGMTCGGRLGYPAKARTAAHGGHSPS